jgi:hypothetical protein
MILQDNRFRFFLFIVGIIILSYTAEKCRQLVGESASSKSGQFTIFNCLDGSTGTVACAVKESAKLYANNLRSVHVDKAREVAVEAVLTEALSRGLSAKDAAKEARKGGDKAAKMATKQAQRIIGPLISSGWDFFEAIYYGGTLTEGSLRGVGTLVGTYAGGFFGDQRFGKFGYLVGSQTGSWIGGRIGLMVYDIVEAVNYLFEFVAPPEESGRSEIFEVEEEL